MADTIRVLVVDEDPNVLDLTAKSLETETPELEVATAASATAALNHVVAEPVDALVTDLVMPEKNGVELAAAVHERDPDLPCVLYTAHDRETVVAEYDTTLSGFVRKRTGTDQYAELASVVRGLAD
ncbi:response regulator [Halobacteriales archaeon QH_3_68_24]|nr:MAG: response regulator [Halobacteriales archaeon QH_3_68_24]